MEHFNKTNLASLFLHIQKHIEGVSDWQQKFRPPVSVILKEAYLVIGAVL